MKEGWSRSLHEKLAQEYDALLQRENAYATAKVAADYLDEKKTAETRAYLQKTMPAHLALFDKTVADQKALATVPTTLEPLKLDLLLDINSETRIYVPVRQVTTSALCKDLYTHVHQVASASLADSAGTLPFGDYVIIKASSANIKELEELLGKTPPAFEASKISIGTLPLHLKLPPLPSKEEYRLPLKESYIEPPLLHIPAEYRAVFPKPGTDFVINDGKEDFPVHVYKKSSGQHCLRGLRPFYQKHHVDPGNTLSVREIKPMEVYGVKVLRTR
jgi:hypothetical protein